MRCIFFCLSGIVAVFFLVLSSCYQHHDFHKDKEHGNVVIVVENFLSQPDRTIAPGLITMADLASTNYKLRLKGTAGRMSFPERDISLTNGRTTLRDIPAGLWELTVTAYNSAGTTAVLVGRATAQIGSVGETSVSFVLTPLKTGTGNVQVSIQLNQADRTALGTGTGRSVVVSLHEKETGRQVHTQTYTNDAVAYTFTKNGQHAGEYELRVRLSGGTIPAGSTMQWSDNLYVEAARTTDGTIVIPQLILIPAAPPYLVSDTGSAEASGRFTTTLSWGTDTIYNNQTYKLEILSFTTGTMPTTDNDWNARKGASGSKVYSYDESSIKKETAMNPYPFFLASGGLGKKDMELVLDIIMDSNRFYCARICSSNASGSSRWVYLQNLLMSQPIIASHTSTKANIKVWAGGRQVDTWNVTLAVEQTMWGNNYEISWLRLRAADSLSNYIYDDAKWLAYQARDGQGVRTRAKASSILLDQLDKDMKFVFRIRTLSPAGKSEWFYYDQETRQLP